MQVPCWSERSPGGHGHPPVSLPGELPGTEGVGRGAYSPQGHEESDMTGRLSTNYKIKMFMVLARLPLILQPTHFTDGDDGAKQGAEPVHHLIQGRALCCLTGFQAASWIELRTLPSLTQPSGIHLLSEYLSATTGDFGSTGNKISVWA